MTAHGCSRQSHPRMPPTVQRITKPPIFRYNSLLKMKSESKCKHHELNRQGFRYLTRVMTWGAKFSRGETCTNHHHDCEGDYEVDVLSLALYIGKCNMSTPIKTFTVKDVGKRSERCHSLFRPVVDERWSRVGQNEMAKRFETRVICNALWIRFKVLK
jgi:hypothetical protein